MDAIVTTVMPGKRLEILKSMVELKPEESFSRYGLAMEYVNTGDPEAAVEQFRLLLHHNPNYAAGYFHGGQTLEKLGRIPEARELYLRGVEVTGNIGDEHTRSELMAALQNLA
jgi:tetratricopeptide (TPR) repeat protein